MPDKTVIGEFLAAHGGPFFELQRRLGLLQEQALKVERRAVIFVGLAWGVPALLSIIEGNLVRGAGTPFLFDPGVWTRFFIAVGAFVLAERQVEVQLRATLAQFTRAPLIAPDSTAKAAALVTTALRRRNSGLAEAVCLALAALASLLSYFNLANSDTAAWALRGPPGDGGLTLAGWWCLVVSSPIFWFLLARGLWRHLVWAMLLRGLSRQKLRLVATHPDGKAGLAFIGRYPNAYAVFMFGMSCVVGAALAHFLQKNTLAISTYGYAMAAWLIIVLGLFALPLLVFTPPLSALKARTLAASGAQATRALRLAERKLLGVNVAVPEAEDGKAPEEIADPSKHYEAARKLSVFLLSRSALVPLGAAALLPLAAAGATLLPYKELLSVVKKLLLL
ncbi:hypothetical protein G5V57_10430 [Nordella sp. HKS 07]|uniref:hypothetical protein n=1 Tax=Nordella sp. HKS 07 TaxID=2712222 RepID=UPI0013E11403|nr:hypothetical protein [Nordella sp. HKS 07]QIG48104.1 hypothetical protein G5V57_10430 [Nordella sp. HKS 07]